MPTPSKHRLECKPEQRDHDWSPGAAPRAAQTVPNSYRAQVIETLTVIVCVRIRQRRSHEHYAKFARDIFISQVQMEIHIIRNSVKKLMLSGVKAEAFTLPKIIGSTKAAGNSFLRTFISSLFNFI